MFHFKRILVPTDFSHASNAAINAAADIAEGRSVDLHLLHVIEPVAVLPPLEMAAIPALPVDDGNVARQRMDRLSIPEDEHQWTVHREVVNGVPDRVIADYAKEHEIDVIVMSTHSRTGLSHFVLGSVTESVVRHALCPVLTIPASAIETEKSTSEETVSSERTS